MRDTKRCLAQFTFYDRTGIRAFLERKAEQGWLLEAISPIFWKFRRIEPKKVHFAVTYFSKASVYDPEPTEQQKSFQEFCAHSGWRLAGINGPLQIFYNQAENPIPIETDPRMELRTIHTSAKKNFLPSYILLLVIAVMQLVLQIGQLVTMPLSYLSSNTSLFNWLSIAVLLIMCVQEIGGYFLWYRKAKRTAEESGDFVATRGHRNSQLALVSILFVGLILLMFTLKLKIAVVMVLCLAGMFGMLFAVLGIKEALKRAKASRGINRAVTIGASVILSFAIVSGLCFGMVNLVQSDFWDEEENTVTYTFNGQIHTLYRHEIPLTVQALVEVDPEIYSYRRFDTGDSVLIGQYDASQQPRYDMLDQPGLQYSVVEVKAKFLYQFCLDKLMETDQYSYTEDIYGNVTYDEYRSIDPTPWGTKSAYREWNGDNVKTTYLLCFENCIVQLDTDWELTEEQMAIVGTVFD